MQRQTPVYLARGRLADAETRDPIAWSSSGAIGAVSFCRGCFLSTLRRSRLRSDVPALNFSCPATVCLAGLSILPAVNRSQVPSSRFDRNGPEGLSADRAGSLGRTPHLRRDRRAQEARGRSMSVQKFELYRPDILVELRDLAVSRCCCSTGICALA